MVKPNQKSNEIRRGIVYVLLEKDALTLYDGMHKLIKVWKRKTKRRKT